MRKEDYQTMNCIFSSFRFFVPFVIVHLFSLQVLSCTLSNESQEAVSSRLSSLISSLSCWWGWVAFVGVGEHFLEARGHAFKGFDLPK